MARIALAVAAAIVGFVIAGPAGASIGLAIGGLAGSLLFPPKLPNQEGPRLNDLTVAVSTSGASIGFGFNRWRIGGNIIWSPGLVEHKTTKQQSAKGGPSYSVTSYTYTASFAAAFGEGPDKVYRLWGDTKLIYGSAIITEPNAECINVEPLTLYGYNGDGTGIFSRTSIGSPLTSKSALAGLMFNTHPSELLPGDPHDSADESNPPVHHIVTKFGTYGGDEVMTGVPIPFDVVIIGTFIVSVPGTYTFKTFADDGYFIGFGGAATMVSGPHVGTLPGTTPMMDYPVFWGMNQAQSYRTSGISGQAGKVNFPTPGEYPFEICWSQKDETCQMSVVLGDAGANWGMYNVIKPAVPKFQLDPYFIINGNISPYPSVATIVSVGEPVLEAGDYATFQQSGTAGVSQFFTWQWRDGVGGPIGSSFDTDFSTQTAAYQFTYQFPIPTNAVYLSANVGSATGLIITRHTVQQHGYEMPTTISSARSKYPAPVIYPGDEVQMPDPTIQAAVGAAKCSANRGVCYAVFEDFLLSDFGNRIPAIRGEVEFMLYAPDGNAAHATSAANIADQVTDICVRAGLSTSQVDVSLLTGTCAGYMIGRPTAARSALQPLAQAFFFDAVESDGKIKFVPRGGSSVLTIPESDLGLEADKAKLTEQQGQEQDLPREITVLFADPAIDYQQNKGAKRRSGRVVKTAQQVVIELPLVLDVNTATQIAERALYLAYSERKPFDTNLWKASYMQVDPTDVVNFVYEGMTFEMRVMKASIGAGFAVSVSGCSENAQNYISTAVGGDAGGFTGGTISQVGKTILWLFDLPLLRDADASAGTGYYFACSSTDASWPGAVLYKSSDNVDFGFEASAGSPVVFGVAMNVLGVPSSPYSWDEVSTLTVMIYGGTLAGVSELSVLNGQNALLVGNEVIQFRDCAQNSDGSFTVSMLLRGRRGTEWACDTHTANETVIDPYTGLVRVDDPLGIIGQERFYKAVTVGQDASTAESQAFMIEGNDLKPYAPVHVTGSRASNDLTIKWVRRTRVGGEWLDGVGDVPLSEDQEMYSVDILNSAGIVKRTFSNLINPQVLYLASDQVIDFGVAQTSVKVVVYQVSAQVGRGFAAEATL